MNDTTTKKLTPDEQKVYDRLVEKCSKPLSKIPKSQHNACVVLKKQLEQEAEQKRIEAEAIAREKLSSARQEATMFVINKVSARQTEATMLLGALMQASSAYDQILAARAAKPFLTELILGVGLAFLPELKVVGMIASRAVPKVTSTLAIRSIEKATKSASSLPAWETMANEIMNKTKTVNNVAVRFGQALDSASNDAIGAIRNPMMSSADADADTQTRLAGFAAKNKVMGDLVGAISRSLWVVTKLQGFLFQYILWTDSPNVANHVRAAFALAELIDDPPYSSKTFDLFADLILYDMLRTYVASYFVVKEVTTEDPDKMPQYWSDDDIDGLDEAQRNLIYQRFKKVPWSDTSRPPVNSYRDLLKYWHGKTKKYPGIRKPTPFGYG